MLYIIYIYSDINECATGSNNCHEDATCTDTKGSFNCTCNDGLIGDGVSCIGQRQ